MGTFGDKNLLKLVCFIVKSSCYNLQINVFLKSAAPDWAPSPNERRPRMSAAPEWAPHLKLWKFKERRGAQTSKYGTVEKICQKIISIIAFIIAFINHCFLRWFPDMATYHCHIFFVQCIHFLCDQQNALTYLEPFKNTPPSCGMLELRDSKRVCQSEYAFSPHP
jgi:hypothetical protein